MVMGVVWEELVGMMVLLKSKSQILTGTTWEGVGGGLVNKRAMRFKHSIFLLYQ